MKTRTLIRLALLASLTLTGCAKSFTGTWRGTCEVELTPESNALAEPTRETRPVEIIVTRDGDRYRMHTQIGADTTCEQGGARPTTNGARQLWFSAMPCSRYLGSPMGGYGSQILTVSNGKMLFSGSLNGQPRSGAQNLRIEAGSCVVSN